MNDELDLEYFKTRLTMRHSTLTADRETQKQSSAPKDLDQMSVGRLSRMDAMQQQQIAKASMRLNDLERQRIETALKRIETEEYGTCVLCDGDIAQKRLEFDPSLLTCVSCAENAERKPR